MRIGIDLDWTLADHSLFWRQLLGDLPRAAYFLLADYGHPVMRKVISTIWTLSRPVLTDGAWPDVIDRLRGLGHEVVVVTNREPGEEKYIEAWLTEVGIKVDGIFCIGVEGDKGKTDIDVLVDDTLGKCYDVARRGGRAFLWLKGMVDRKAVSVRLYELIRPVAPVWSAWEFYANVLNGGGRR